MNRDCEHGQQARVCPICERDKRIAELEANLAGIKKTIDDYSRCDKTMGRAVFDSGGVYDQLLQSISESEGEG
jgi:hypothetical protein